MALEWLLSALIIAVATPAFGHFETVRPTWIRIVRWLAYLAVTGLLGATVGRPWTLIWVLGLPAAGATFHIAWCLRHGINPLTAEPRDRYEELRAPHRPVATRESMTGHAHSHGLGGHTAAATERRGARYLTAALALILAFMAVEVIVGILASSLALISDAGHMLTDAAAIALALIAARLATRPARGNLTYGLKRVEILSAQANGITLWLLSAWFLYEAVRRLLNPPKVAGGLVLITALVGIVVNLGASLLVARADRTSLNVEGAFQHILNDLFAFIATAIAGLVVLLTGWGQADAIAALVVAALMAKAGWGLIRDSWRIFLEAAPRGMNVAAVDADLHAVAGVLEVHDLHVWEVTSGFPALSAHILVDHSHDCHERRQTITALLHERYGLDHTTLQVDHATPSIVPADELSRRLHPKQPEIDDPHAHHSTPESASHPLRPSEPHT